MCGRSSQTGHSGPRCVGPSVPIALAVSLRGVTASLGFELIRTCGTIFRICANQASISGQSSGSYAGTGRREQTGLSSFVKPGEFACFESFGCLFMPRFCTSCGRLPTEWYPLHPCLRTTLVVANCRSAGRLVLRDSGRTLRAPGVGLHHRTRLGRVVMMSSANVAYVLCRSRWDSFESSADGRFCFHVEIKHPLAGLIVRYSGWLVLDEADASIALPVTDRRCGTLG